jgi:hypothetical protein
MRKIAVLLAAALLLLTSCIGIDSRLTLQDDGSGTLALTYRVSQLVADLGLSSTGGTVIPLPLSRTDFDRAVEGSKGKVRVARFDRSENEKDITISVQLAFDSFDALAQMDAFRDAGLKLASDGTGRTYTQLIARAPARPLSDTTLQMFDALFSDYALSFALHVPRPIQSSTVGTLSSDKRTLTYSAPVRDIVTTKADIVLTAVW